MAEGNSSSKGFAKVLNKKLFRTKEKVLQNLGKADKTTDDAFDEHVTNFQKQQTAATKLQKELKNYITCVKAMSTASHTFYDCVKDTYETEWTGYTELISAVEHLSVLWDDYLRKLIDDVQTPLNTYISKFPDTRRLSIATPIKRPVTPLRRLVENFGEKIKGIPEPEIRIMAESDAELTDQEHSPVPSPKKTSRWKRSPKKSPKKASKNPPWMFAWMMKSKISKRGRKLVDYDSSRHHLDATSNAKKKDEGKIQKALEEMEDARRIYEDLNNELHDDLPYLYNSRISFYANHFNALFRAEGKFQEESARIKNSMVDATDRLSRECENQGDKVYVAKRPSSQRSKGSNEDIERNTVQLGDTESGPGLSKFYNVAIPNDVANDKDSENERRSMSGGSSVESDPDTEPSPKENHKDVVAFPDRNGDIEEESEKRKSQDQAYEPITVGAQDPVQETDIIGPDSPNDERPPPHIEAKAESGNVAAKEEEFDDDDEEEDEKQPSIINNNRDKEGESTYTVAGDTEDIYKVPPSNEPVENENSENLSQNELYKVKATHSYTGEDVDELTFEAGEIIRVIPFEDPEDQDEGWLMGVKESTNDKGVFPANFTKKM